ncbi:MAG: hypothetical protein Q7U34_03375, partial [Anaerolineales bacterium]|nr:hypothetical protein [Anaerolineales bacterium]
MKRHTLRQAQGNAFLIAIFIGLLSLTAMASTPTPPVATPAPAPSATPTPTPVPIVTQIFHVLRFPAESIYDALTNVFTRTSEEERENLEKEVDQWSLVFAEVFQAPSEKQYTNVAKGSLPVAAALAVPIFLLRLAIYHWNRLTGENDSPLRAIGDWITAGVMAVAAGPVLDLMVQAGWWVVFQSIFKALTPKAGAAQFIGAITIGNLGGVALTGMFFSIVSLALTLGGLLALAAMLFSFAAASAAMFVIAILAPTASVLGAIPQMAWLRSLLLKAATLLALLPIVTGGIFVAGIAATKFFSGGGLLGPLVRLFWLWGAAGLLMSMAGILGKITLGGAGEALGKITGGVKAVAGLAAAAGLAATGVGAAAAPAVAAGAAGAGAGGAGAGAAGAAGAGAQAGGGAASAMGHLNAAQNFTNWSAGLGALGMHGPASMARGLASGQQIAAQKVMLQQRAGDLASPVTSPEKIAEQSSGLA